MSLLFTGTVTRVSKDGLSFLSVGLLLIFLTAWGFAHDKWMNVGLGHGGRALAMGGAFVAVANDLSAVSHNPAGLAQISGPEFTLSGVYAGQSAHQPFLVNDNFSQSSFDYGFRDLSFSFAGTALPLRLGRSTIVVGLSYRREFSFDAIYSYVVESANIFGVPPSGYYRRTSVFDVDSHGSLNAATLSLAFRVLRAIYLGLNINLWHGQADELWLHQRFVTRYDYGQESSGSWSKEYSHHSYGFRAAVSGDFGILWKMSIFSFGLMVKTRFKAFYDTDYFDEWKVVDSDGNAFDVIDTASYRSDFRIPSGVGFGISVRPAKLWTLSMEYNAMKTRDSPLYPYLNKSLCAGCEYRYESRNLSFPLRAGFFLKWEPEQEKAFPGFTVGAGLNIWNLALDMGAIIHTWHYHDPYYADLGPARNTSWVLFLSLSYNPTKRTSL